MNKVLVVAVHPDDETLGAGGALLKHQSDGDEIHWLIVTCMSGKMGYSSQAIQKRDAEIKQVSEAFKFNSVQQLNIPATQVNEVATGVLVSQFAEVIQKLKPTTIYLPFKGDVHSDHRASFDAAYSCTKTFNYPFINKILMMETLSETDFAAATIENAFIPNSFVNISDFIDKKLDILKIFESEIKKHPFPRSIENVRALATYRGATAGFSSAESFMLLRERIG